MKAGKVREDGKRRPAALGFLHEMPHGANEGGQALQDFGNSHDGNFGIIGDNFDARGTHLRSAHSEDGDVEALLQGGGKPGGVHVSGSFTGGEKERNGRHVWCLRRSVAGGERGRLSGIIGFDGKMQLLLLVLELVETVVNAALREKLLMRALFAQASFVK